MIEINVSNLQTYLDSAVSELAELKKGKKAAATRSRKHILSLQRECAIIRKSIMTHVKELPVKPRAIKNTVKSNDLHVEPVVEEPMVVETNDSREETNDLHVNNSLVKRKRKVD